MIIKLIKGHIAGCETVGEEPVVQEPKEEVKAEPVNKPKKKKVKDDDNVDS